MGRVHYWKESQIEESQTDCSTMEDHGMAGRLFTINPKPIIQTEEGRDTGYHGPFKRTSQPSQKLPARLGRSILGPIKAILPEEERTLGGDLI